MTLTIRQHDYYRHDRYMVALISLSLTVTLSGISCTPLDKQYKGATLDVENKKTLADLLPLMEDIESITLVNLKEPGGHVDTTQNPMAELPKSDWPGAYSAFRHTKAVIIPVTLPVYGEALMKTRDGKTYEITIFVLDGKDVVYYIYKQPNPKEIGSPYFMSTLTDELLPDLLPKWQ